MPLSNQLTNGLDILKLTQGQFVDYPEQVNVLLKNKMITINQAEQCMADYRFIEIQRTLLSYPDYISNMFDTTGIITNPQIDVFHIETEIQKMIGTYTKDLMHVIPKRMNPYVNWVAAYTVGMAYSILSILEALTDKRIKFNGSYLIDRFWLINLSLPIILTHNDQYIRWLKEQANWIMHHHQLINQWYQSHYHANQQLIDYFNQSFHHNNFFQ